jgi:predicted DNA-binding helix-hairpin-helix protein
MGTIHTSPDVSEKLSILSSDAQYDLACACGNKDGIGRQRSAEGKWIYPVALPSGGTTYLLKTLVSNACSNDCKYCPLRQGRDVRRCTISPEEIAKVFMEYLRAGKVSGIFLSSGVTGSPDQSMERLIDTVRILRRKERFRGYVHLKVIPGASDEAIREAVALSNAVSVNIEVPGEKNFKRLSAKKNYLTDVIRPMKLISELTSRDGPYRRVKQTTQFVVGASGEKDSEIIEYTWGLYTRLRLQRVYFSAYQKGLGSAELPGESAEVKGEDLLTREHRLYQVDWLIRKYGFEAKEIPLDGNGNLDLARDPKEVWAGGHPEFYPVNVNSAAKDALLRVPGLGPTTVNRIIAVRGERRLKSMRDIGRAGARLNKAEGYVAF